MLCSLASRSKRGPTFIEISKPIIEKKANLQRNKVQLNILIDTYVYANSYYRNILLYNDSATFIHFRMFLSGPQKRKVFFWLLAS